MNHEQRALCFVQSIYSIVHKLQIPTTQQRPQRLLYDSYSNPPQKPNTVSTLPTAYAEHSTHYSAYAVGFILLDKAVFLHSGMLSFWQGTYVFYDTSILLWFSIEAKNKFNKASEDKKTN